MKNLSKLYLAAIIMVCGYLTSCNTKENLLMPDFGDNATLASKSLNKGMVFTVSPSGNYNDDSYNIQTALNNAVLSGPGSTVQLTEGTFYLKYRIEVEGFDGYFKGAGKEKTIITTHDVVEFNLPAPDVESLIKFRHGNINVSDLTIKISNPTPCAGINDSGWGFKTALPSVITITGNSSNNPGDSHQDISCNFHNVKFIGGAGDWMDYFNVNAFVWRTWDAMDWESPIYTLQGDFNFTNCEFNKACRCICSDLSDGPCVVGGDELSANTFEDTYYATLLVDMSNSTANVSYNHYSRVYTSGVQIFQGANVYTWDLSLSKYTICCNHIEARPFDPDDPESFSNGIAVYDMGPWDGEGKKLDVNINGNKIFLNNNIGGIFGCCVTDAVITSNKLWGTGLAGILFGIWDDPCSYGLIKEGNVINLNAQLAPIWLGSGASNFLVYADKNDVLDEGTDNVVIGDHNKRSDNPGAEIREKMMRHMDMMNLHKHRGRNIGF